MRVRVIDFESTSADGPEPDHGLVEIGFCDVVQRDGEWRVAGAPTSMLVHPGRSIPPEVSAIHHIIDEDVVGCRPWKEVLAEVIKTPWGDEPIVALAAHSARFEKLWCTADMTGPLPWICSLKVSYRMFPSAPGFSNSCLRYWRKPEGLRREAAMPAHRAGPDAYTTAFLVRDMLNHAGVQIEHLIKVSERPALLPKVMFGKHRGKAWSEVDAGYLTWVCRQDDMDEDVKFTAQHWLNGGKT